MSKIYSEIREERIRQDAQWGGAVHDDDHTATSDGACWRDFVSRQMALAEREHAQADGATAALNVQRSRYIKIAALAVAAVESIDRTLTS